MSPSSSELIRDNITTGCTISLTYENWSHIRRIIDKVHKHVCRHSTYSDMIILLQRTKLWNKQAQNYLSSVVSHCPDFKASSTPPPNGRVSLASLNRDFNDSICMDYMFLDKVTVFHMMDVATHFLLVLSWTVHRWRTSYIIWKTSGSRNFGLPTWSTFTEHSKMT